MYLRGGSIIPVGPPLQHVGEANPNDDLILLVALDEDGIIPAPYLQRQKGLTLTNKKFGV